MGWKGGGVNLDDNEALSANLEGGSVAARHVVAGHTARQAARRLAVSHTALFVDLGKGDEKTFSQIHFPPSHPSRAVSCVPGILLAAARVRRQARARVVRQAVEDLERAMIETESNHTQPFIVPLTKVCGD